MPNRMRFNMASNLCTYTGPRDKEHNPRLRSDSLSLLAYESFLNRNGLNGPAEHVMTSTWPIVPAPVLHLKEQDRIICTVRFR